LVISESGNPLSFQQRHPGQPFQTSRKTAPDVFYRRRTWDRRQVLRNGFPVARAVRKTNQVARDLIELDGGVAGVGP